MKHLSTSRSYDQSKVNQPIYLDWIKQNMCLIIFIFLTRSNNFTQLNELSVSLKSILYSNFAKTSSQLLNSTPPTPHHGLTKTSSQFKLPYILSWAIIDLNLTNIISTEPTQNTNKNLCISFFRHTHMAWSMHALRVSPFIMCIYIYVCIIIHVN